MDYSLYTGWFSKSQARPYLEWAISVVSDGLFVASLGRHQLHPIRGGLEWIPVECCRSFPTWAEAAAWCRNCEFDLSQQVNTETNDASTTD